MIDKDLTPAEFAEIIGKTASNIYLMKNTNQINKDVFPALAEYYPDYEYYLIRGENG